MERMVGGRGRLAARLEKKGCCGKKTGGVGGDEGGGTADSAARRREGGVQTVFWGRQDGFASERKGKGGAGKETCTGCVATVKRMNGCFDFKKGGGDLKEYLDKEEGSK